MCESLFSLKKTGCGILVVALILILSGTASAAVTTYFWTPSTGAIGSSGFTANWGSCGAQPTSYKITDLSNNWFTCNRDYLTTKSAGDQFLAIFPTAYSADTQITGQSGTFYLEERSEKGAVTYRFDMGYAKNGTFTSLGNVTQIVPKNTKKSYSINMSKISGTVPSGSFLALKVSVTSTSGEQRIYLGKDYSNSGKFSVDEVIISQTPTPTPTPTPTSPTPTPTPTPPPTPTPTGQYLVKVSTNRYVVLDDPNEPSTAASGFFKPSDVRGGSYGKDYWSGESTTIRAVALVTDTNGTPKSGVIVNFALRNPAGGTPINTASSTTNTDGVAYYSFNLNEQKYWGYWKIDASVGSTQGSASFALNFWGCGQCHGDENPGKWGTRYTPKSYYTMGYDFHKSQTKTWHTEPMTKGACIVCHQMYNGTPVNYKFTDNSNTFKVDNEYSPDWHTGKVTCAGCHAGSNISKTPQGKNPEIAGCYDTTGCHPKKNTNVGKKNSTTGYVVGGNYRTIYSAIPTNSAKAHTPNSVECIACHSAGHNVTKPYNVSSTSNTYTENEHCWACHTDRIGTHYNDSSCVGCHSQNAHKIAIGGGPDCLSCHNIGGSAMHKVDGNAMNQTGAVHKGLNKNATANLDSNNKRCWACHTNVTLSADNVVNEEELPPAGHPDAYKTPKDCIACHRNSTGNLKSKQVFAHQQNAVPKDLNKPVNTTFSCVMCHNNSRLNATQGTLEAEISHYATTANLVKGGGNVDQSYCRTCHQNFNTGKNYGLGKITNNHDLASTCLNFFCHRSGTTATSLHDSNIIKPAFYYNSENDNYCTNCHPIGGITGWGAPHGNKTSYVTCTNCHINYTANVTRLTYTPGARQVGTVYHTDNGTPSYSYNGLAPGNNSYPKGSIEYNRSRCTVCHDRGVEHNVVSDCTSCHKGGDVVNTYARPVYHSQNITGGGGPDCLSCHNNSGSATHRIDGGAVALGIHANLNSQAVNTNVPAENKKCWGCHQTDGEQPTGMGDIYKNPYRCYDCHGTAKPYSNVSNALTVNEHFKNGTDIKAATSAMDSSDSCLLCHNLSEMKVPYTDFEYTKFSLPSHYGKNRTDIRVAGSTGIVSTECKYCHQNATTAFSIAMVDPSSSRSIANHSVAETTPLCTACHEEGKLHDSQLDKPVSSVILCKKCHAVLHP